MLVPPGANALLARGAIFTLAWAWVRCCLAWKLKLKAKPGFRAPVLAICLMRFVLFPSVFGVFPLRVPFLLDVVPGS